MIVRKIINNGLLIKLRRSQSEKPLSLRELGEKTKLSTSVIHRIECGKNQNPEIKAVISICEFYDITLFEILESELSSKMMQSYLNKMVANGVIPEVTKNKILAHHHIMINPSSDQQ